MTNTASKTKLTMAERDALRMLAVADIWTITMADEFCATVARLAGKGLVKYVPRIGRRGGLHGSDATLTDAGRAAAEAK